MQIVTVTGDTSNTWFFATVTNEIASGFATSVSDIVMQWFFATATGEIASGFAVSVGNIAMQWCCRGRVGQARGTEFQWFSPL